MKNYAALHTSLLTTRCRKPRDNSNEHIKSGPNRQQNNQRAGINRGQTEPGLVAFATSILQLPEPKTIVTIFSVVSYFLHFRCRYADNISSNFA